MFYIFVVLHIILTLSYILFLQYYLMLYFILYMYYVMFLQILLDMLVLVIIKLCNFHVLYFCGITYYSYPLLHIILTILPNLYFILFLVLLNVLTYLLDMLVLMIIKLCNFHVLYFCGITYYSYPLVHIMLTILLNVIFYSFFFCIT